jgi:mRNA-degrading endonuclease HigB of HigAB toxin-antitoxin module
MRIISESRLREFWEANPQQSKTKKSLQLWYAVTKQAAWRNPADVKQGFGKNVDFVQSDNGSELAVFNIHANHFRLIAAIHYLPHHHEKGRVYVLRIMSHEAYDLNRWKEDL